MYYDAFITSPISPASESDKRQLLLCFQEFLKVCREGVLVYAENNSTQAVIDVLVDAFNRFVQLTDVDVPLLSLSVNTDSAINPTS